MTNFKKATKVIDPLMDAAYKKRGVIMLGRYNFPPQVLWSNKKLTSLATMLYTRKKCRLLYGLVVTRHVLLNFYASLNFSIHNA